MSEQRARLVAERAAAAEAEVRELAAGLADAAEARVQLVQYRRDVKRAFARLPALAARKVTGKEPAIAFTQLQPLLRAILTKLAGPEGDPK